MVKLVRIVSTENNGVFTSTLNQDLHIEKGSSIALKDISFDTVNEAIVINALNNQITFQLKVGSSHTVDLAEESYTTINQDDLLADITTKLNNALSLNVPKEIGAQFLCKTDSSNKTSIGYKIASYAWTASLYNKTANVTATAQGLIDQNSGAGDATTRNKYYMGTEWGKGCSVFRARINKLTDNGGADNTNGFSIGLSRQKPSVWKDSLTMTDEQRYFEIYIDKPTNNYFLRMEGGTLIDSGITPEETNNGRSTNNDILEIALTDGNIVGSVYQLSAGTQQLFSLPYNNVDVFYPFILLRGARGNCRIEAIKQTEDMFALPTNQIHVSTNNDLDSRPPQPSTSNTVNTMNLPDDLAEFLGYSNSDNTQSAIEANFVSDGVFSNKIFNDSFIIISDSIKLNSYDSLIRGSKSILATIPQSDEKGYVIYEPNERYFVDISNKENLIVRSLRFRILRSDLTGIVVRGISTLTLLIK